MGPAEGAMGDRGGSGVEAAAGERAPPRLTTEETQTPFPLTLQEPGETLTHTHTHTHTHTRLRTHTHTKGILHSFKICCILS